MIVGIGTDIVKVERVRRLLERYPNFVERVFCAGEITHCQGKANPEQSYATRFAAKEAVMKALGTGWDGRVNWRDIEVFTDKNGKPDILLRGGALERLTALAADRVHLSLTHEKEYALAFVVLERQKLDSLRVSE